MKQFKIVLFLLFTTVIFSQTNLQKPFIEVTGTSEIEIVPNEIYLDIILKERVEKGKKLSISFLEEQLKSSLKALGIPEKNLSISDINAAFSKTGWWKEEILSNANYTLKVSGASTLKNLFDRFKTLQISEVKITKATHSDLMALKKENRIKAIKVAKEKSDYLLNAIGEETGKPLMINEIVTSNQHFVNANFTNRTKLYRTENDIKKETVQFKKLKISSSIYVKFLIK